MPINLREQSDNRLEISRLEFDKAVKEASSTGAWDSRDYYLNLYKLVRHEQLKRELDEYYINAYSSERSVEVVEDIPIPHDAVSNMRYVGFKGLE